MIARRTLRRIALAIGLVGALVGLGLAAPALHLIDADPMRLFASSRRAGDTVAVYVSGDLGLRFGMGPKVAPALAAHGIPVVGVSSPVAFGTRRTRAEADAIIAGAVRTALARTGAKRAVLIGQSFGSDIVATTLPDLPPDLRRRIAAVVLVVPGESVFFRADPTGITYHGTPDAAPAAALRGVDWTPVVCIYGEAETDSLCPALDRHRAEIIPLPGGHFLHHDDQLLTRTILDALRRADRTITG